MQYTDDLEDRLDNTRKTYHSHAHEVQFHRETARTTVEAVQAAVAAEKKGVDDNVSRILEEIESALLKGSMAVDDTSQVANKIVDDVGASSSKMNETVSESMTTFGRYMDKEGEELSSALGKHFGVVGTHLEAQAGGLSALREGGEQHGQSIADSTLQPRSTTPRKLRKESSSSLQPLPSTQDHTRIKQQARDELLADLETQFLLFRGELEGQLQGQSNGEAQSPPPAMRSPGPGFSSGGAVGTPGSSRQSGRHQGGQRGDESPRTPSSSN